MHTLDDMLRVHNRTDIAVHRSGTKGEFLKEYWRRFKQVHQTFAQERNLGSLENLLDAPGSTQMGPESERQFVELLLWLEVHPTTTKLTLTLN